MLDFGRFWTVLAGSGKLLSSSGSTIDVDGLFIVLGLLQGYDLTRLFFEVMWSGPVFPITLVQEANMSKKGKSIPLEWGRSCKLQAPRVSLVASCGWPAFVNCVLSY